MQTFNITPSLPKELEKLLRIAYNFWFCWNVDAINLFHRLDPELWEQVSHNPVRMLGMIDQAILEEKKTDEGYLMQLDRVSKEFDEYLGFKTSYSFKMDQPIDFSIAYFSAEFGLSDALPIYSGGLGILSGDHIKSASDLKIPLIGIGLLYQHGYFRQYLSTDGWQQETYIENDFANLPITLVKDNSGSPIIQSVMIMDREVFFYIWKVEVGRNDLYLMDTNIQKNGTNDREITAQLYGGDSEMRLKQEIVLGIGGTKVINTLGLKPMVYHMNEGHSAFAILERINHTMKEYGFSFNEAKEMVISSNVFTTHTPVPAGVDKFNPELISQYLSVYVSGLGISIDELLRMGRINPEDQREHFSMLVFAMKFSAYRNAVSKLHQKISQNMWKDIWPGFPNEETTIDWVTNGIHIPSWISTDMGGLYDRYLGRRWTEDPDNKKVWEKINTIPDSELWRTHERRRERLIGFTRRRLRQQLKAKGASRPAIEKASEVLNPEAMTIGFARRFATYKRGNLIFRDPERLLNILRNRDKPVQIIFSGKAHPKDNEGKRIIQNIYHFLKDEAFKNHIAFIEDYDINVARYMVQGVDVWLNIPRRPEEACGTSGMKAAANGAVNMSILDGWWDEAYSGDNGWAIGKGEVYEDHTLQDDIESKAVYSLLEEEVIPLFFKKGKDNVPNEWVKMMKKSLSSLCGFFNTHRMVEDYLFLYYYPASSHFKLYLNDPESNRKFASWKDYMGQNWHTIKPLDIETYTDSVKITEPYEVRLKLHLGNIKPADIQVELYYGRLDHRSELLTRDACPMKLECQNDDTYIYKGNISSQDTGKYGFFIRILPKHQLLSNFTNLNLVHWIG